MEGNTAHHACMSITFIIQLNCKGVSRTLCPFYVFCSCIYTRLQQGVSMAAVILAILCHIFLFIYSRAHTEVRSLSPTIISSLLLDFCFIKMRTFFLVIALVAVSASACSCMRPPAFQTAVLGVGNIQITYTVRPEGCLDTVDVTTGGNSALCGVRLKINTKYVLRLKKDRSPSGVSSCGVWRAFDDLSAADKLFVSNNVPGRCTATSCAAVLCQTGFFCRNGQCLDRCALIRCKSGYGCKAGQCLPSCRTIKCRPGFGRFGLPQGMGLQKETLYP